MKRLYLVLLVLLTACANNPELTLLRGYQASSATVKTATTLVNRDQISVTEAENVKTLGTTAKATLDAGSADLKKCRATPGMNCNVQPNIQLGAGVLQQLEDYLKAKGVK